MIPVTSFNGNRTWRCSGWAAPGWRRTCAGRAVPYVTPGTTKARGRCRGLAGIPVVDLRSADWNAFAALVLAPGVPLTHPAPHWTVDLARHAGIEVIGDVELFCRERKKLARKRRSSRSPGPTANRPRPL
jgi:UDP-N-acetylmuramoylalanine--D-glutamate ligase